MSNESEATSLYDPFAFNNRIKPFGLFKDLSTFELKG